MARLACIAACLSLILPATAAATVELSSNGRGDQVLIHRVELQHGRPLFAATRAPGGSFGALSPISSPEVGGFHDYTIVDEDGGSVTLWWTVGAQGVAEGAPKVVTRAPGGGFGAPVEVVPGENGAPVLAGNAKGDAIAALTGYAQPGRYRFRPAGGSFGPVSELPGTDPLIAGMAVDPDGSVLVLWSEYRPGRPSTMAMSLRPPGGDFGPPEEVPLPEAARNVTFNAARNGRGLLVWDEGSAIKAMERAPGGDFGPPFEIAANADAAAGSPSIALAPSGAAAVLYNDFRRSFLVTRDPGGAFGAPHLLARGTLWSQALMALDNRGDLALVGVAPNHVLRSRYRRAAGTLGATRLLTAARPHAPGADYPGLTMEESGRATIGWEESDGDTIRTFTRDFDATHRERAVHLDSVPSVVREGPPEACRPAGAPVLASSARATVFDAGFQAGGVQGCLLARGTPVPLVIGVEGAVQPSAIAFAGPLVAYASGFSGHSSSTTYLNVLDLRDPDSGLNRGIAPEGFDHDSILAVARLRTNSAVAWIDCPRTLKSGAKETDETCMRAGGMQKRLYAWNAHATKPRLLDSGRRVDPRTLRLRGARLTWRGRGKLHHAILR